MAFGFAHATVIFVAFGNGYSVRRLVVTSGFALPSGVQKVLRCGGLPILSIDKSNKADVQPGPPVGGDAWFREIGDWGEGDAHIVHSEAES